jgi:predicted ester cyclase
MALHRRHLAPGAVRVIEEVIAPTYVHHTSHRRETAARGAWAGWRQTRQTAWRSGVSLISIYLEDLFVEGDKVVARWTCRGTHHGIFRGLAPTGKRVTFTGMTLYRMAQGKIVEQWTVEDGVSLYQQLGILRS